MKYLQMLYSSVIFNSELLHRAGMYDLRLFQVMHFPNWYISVAFTKKETTTFLLLYNVIGFGVD